MKRSEHRLLEEKLRYVAMEDIELDPERDQQMLEQARNALMQQSTETDKEIKRSHGHGIGRRVLIVSAAAVVLLVMSFGIAVLMPESVSHARGFMRTAAIWVNNTLHLGYEFEEPMENQALKTDQYVTYYSLEAAAANLPYPLLYLDDSTLPLQSVCVYGMASSTKTVITYGSESEYCKIELVPTATSAVTSVENELQELIPWQCGELIVWQTDTAGFALTYYANLEVNIMGLDIPYDNFLTLCQTLKEFN